MSGLLQGTQPEGCYSAARVTPATPCKLKHWGLMLLKGELIRQTFRPGSPLSAMPANSFLISAIALPGLRPLGQVFVQFMMVWHLYTEKGSLSLSSLAACCSSLLEESGYLGSCTLCFLPGIDNPTVGLHEHSRSQVPGISKLQIFAYLSISISIKK